MSLSIVRKALIVILATVLLSVSHAHAQSTWDNIMKSKTIRVGVVQAEPWGFKDPISGNWTGLIPSYAKAVAAALGAELELVEVTWGSAIPAIQQEQEST